MSNEPAFRTERFDVHEHEIFRSEAMGGLPRTVFHAWFHSDYDVAKPVCIVTVFVAMAYVEWIHVDEHWRREGIATEVMRGIEKYIGPLEIFGVTDAGIAFCEAMTEKRKGGS